MAYTIKCDRFTLYDVRDDELVVYAPKCKLEANTSGEASFTIYSQHPFYGVLKKLRSIFEIQQDEDVIFRGRMTEDSVDFDNAKAVDLEGVLAFFNDSTVRPFNFPGDFNADTDYREAYNSGNVVRFFLNWLITQHNNQVEEFQRFKLGKVTVTDPNNYFTRSNSDYASTWETLKTKLFNSELGGYLCIRYEADGNYIDYLADFEKTNSQHIKYGENLLDLSTDSDASATYSAIIPLGKKKNEIDTESSDTSRLTIADLPDGNITDDVVKKGDVLYSKSAVAAYGFICAPTTETTWDDVTIADNLQSKGFDWLTEKAPLISNTTTTKAVDLHFSDEEIEAFRIYSYVSVSSAPHGYEDNQKLTKLDIDIQNPQNTLITFGEVRQSLTDINSSIKQRVSGQVEEAKTIFQTSLSEQESRILQLCNETITSKTEQLANSITLSITGSLGNTAQIAMQVGERVIQTDLELSKVREAFANDKSSVTVSGGVVTFNAGTLVINSTNFKVSATGVIEATNAKISGQIITEKGVYKAQMDSGGLDLYYNDVLCGTVNTKYWSGASSPGISLRVEEGGQYLMFSHADDTQGSGYTVDYYLNAGWSSNYDEKHIFQTSARFLSDVYIAGKTRIRSLRLFGSDGEYLVGINSSGALTVSKL